MNKQTEKLEKYEIEGKKSEQKKGRKDDLIVVAHKHIAFWMRFLAEDMNGTWSELIDE